MNLENHFKAYKQELTKNLGNYNFPELLEKLMQFNLDVNGERYLGRFQLLGNYSDDIWEFFRANDVDAEYIETLEKKLIPFASRENATFYFWLHKDKSTEELPIVVLSSDGWIAVEASNLTDLIKMLPAGKDEEFPEYVNVDLLHKFRKWVSEELGITPAKTYEEKKELQQKAKKQYKASFDKWLNKFGYE